MIAFASVVSEDVVAVDDFVECIPFQPCFLYKVYILAFSLHGGNKVFIACIVVLFMNHRFAIGVTGLSA